MEGPQRVDAPMPGKITRVLVKVGDEVQEGQEAGITSATFIIKGRYAYGMLAGERRILARRPTSARRGRPAGRAARATTTRVT